MLDRNGQNNDYDTAGVLPVPFVASMAPIIQPDSAGDSLSCRAVNRLRAGQQTLPPLTPTRSAGVNPMHGVAVSMSWEFTMKRLSACAF